MAYVDTSAGAGPIQAQGRASVGGAPTGGGTASAPVPSGQPGANGPGTNISQSRYVVAFILLDVALLIALGVIFKERNL